MTSSLVGSEMCIRDRKSKLPVKEQVEDSDSSVLDPINTEVMKETSETVSYTHLTLPTICSV
eukprot:5629971-Prorocentrum_lima.AAC.1